MPKQEAPRAITITVAGIGADADAQARALRGVEGVEIERLTGANDDDTAPPTFCVGESGVRSSG